MPNRLIHAKSHYLLKAAHQPVNWYEWGEEAFAAAAREDKPILLSVGGVWCHWCHVMAHECFENPEIADLINCNFIPVKVDRDERPDIDRRYQDFVVRISGSGGWPLTVFLTPEGKAFFGGTYFPPEEKWERPGLKTIITKLSEIYRTDRWRIDNAADEFYKSAMRVHGGSERGDLEESLLRTKLEILMESVDMSHGGFGQAPKFHHASALEFLMNHDYFHPDGRIRDAVLLTLDKMAEGGIYDHLLGGFFRYSTDERWAVPHFEKMLSDNAELLNIYSIAFGLFGRESYRSAAEGIIRYYERFGSSAQGGFYASQDADIGILDEGGHYTFSTEDLRGILSEEEAQVISLHLGIRPAAQSSGHGHKSVPHIEKSPAMVAAITGFPVARVSELIASAVEKMRRHREEQREQPFIDTAVYAGWNGLMIEALCRAGALLGDGQHVEKARRAADHVIASNYRDGTLYRHHATEGFAEDYIFLVKGLLCLFEQTQESRYLATSVNLTDEALALFWDSENWGFLDARKKGPGYLSIGVRNIQDTPTQSVNGVAPLVLMQLNILTGETKYLDYAEKTLKAFAELVRQYPHAADSYFVSLMAYFKGLYKIGTSQWFKAALQDFRPYKLVVCNALEGAVICVKETCRVHDHYPVPDERVSPRDDASDGKSLAAQ